LKSLSEAEITVSPFCVNDQMPGFLPLETFHLPVQGSFDDAWNRPYNAAERKGYGRKSPDRLPSVLVPLLGKARGIPAEEGKPSITVHSILNAQGLVNVGRPTATSLLLI
jgi:hypothetical protein